MPVEFDLDGVDSDTNEVRFQVKVRLEEDMTWHTIDRAVSHVPGRKLYSFPSSGSWHVVQATPLPRGVGITSFFRGTLVLNVPNLTGVAVFMGQFFPASVGRNGHGTATGWQGQPFPTSKALWRITLAKDMLVEDFPAKFAKAVELAKAKFISKLGPAVYKTLTDPMFIGLIAIHFVRNPATWFKVLRGAVGKVLALWSVVSFAYRFNGILLDIDAAQTPTQLAAAGNALAEALADLAAQIGVQAVLGIFEAIRAAREMKDTKGGESTKREAGANPPPEYPPQYRSWREGIRDLENRIHEQLRNADPRNPEDFFHRLNRAVGLRVQISWWRRFIIETAHHVEWLRNAAPMVQKMAAEVRSIVNKNGGTRKGYPAALEWLKTQMRNAGIPFDFADKNALEVIRALDICGDLDWSAHDTETWMTTKFNEIVSKGLKNPFNFRELGLKWTEEQYRQAAEGWDPRPGREGSKLTEQDMIEIFGDYSKTFLSAFGSIKDVFQGVIDAKTAYDTHNETTPDSLAPGHHQPGAGMQKMPKDNVPAAYQDKAPNWEFTNWSNNKLFSSGMLERGADVAHAMLQLRLYRVFYGKKPFTVAEVAAEFKTDPFVLFGLMVFTKFNMNDVVNPCTVSEGTMKGLGMPDLILEARTIARHNASGK